MTSEEKRREDMRFGQWINLIAKRSYYDPIEVTDEAQAAGWWIGYSAGTTLNILAGVPSGLLSRRRAQGPQRS